MFSPQMPLWVRPEDVILRMQLDENLAGVTDVVGDAIASAQLHVQRILGFKLERQSLDCRFFLDAQAFSGITPGGVFRVELPNGFIRQDTALTVMANELGPFGTYEAINTSLLNVDYVRGYLLLDATEYANKYLRVICDTGFEGGLRPYPTDGIDVYSALTTYSADDFVVFNGIVYQATMTTIGQDPTNEGRWQPKKIDQEQLPIEVFDAIMSMVPVVMDAGQTTNRNAEAERAYIKACDHAVLLLQPMMRTKGFSFRQTM